MTEVDKAAQYQLAETLRGEQNFAAGTAAAIVAALAGAVVWGVISALTGYVIGWIAIGIGVLVGYGMQVFGKGLNAKYSIVASIFAVLGCAAGNLSAALIFEMREYGVSLAELIGYLTIDDIILFYQETLELVDLIFWLLAVGSAWQFAPRKLTDEEGLAVHAWENRPAGGMISE